MVPTSLYYNVSYYIYYTELVQGAGGRPRGGHRAGALGRGQAGRRLPLRHPAAPQVSSPTNSEPTSTPNLETSHLNLFNLPAHCFCFAISASQYLLSAGQLRA